MREDFITWIKEMKEGKRYDVFHLPVCATLNDDGSINLADKGIGLHDVEGELAMIGLEMYGTKTYTNILRTGKCSLRFTDLKTSRSYQVDCDVDILEKGSEEFKLHTGRHNSYHNEVNPICGYRFKISQVLDKRPM